MKGRLGCLFIAGVIGLFWAGGQNVYTGMTNRTPTRLSLAEYTRTKPSAHWLHLTNCRLIITDAMVRGSVGSIKELFIPVRPEGDSSGMCAVLLSTQDPGLLLLYQQLQKSARPEEAIGILLSHKDKVYNREIQGLVRFGIEMKDKERRKLSQLDKTLTSDFIILNEGSEPSVGTGIGLLAGGLALAGVGAALARRSS